MISMGRMGFYGFMSRGKRRYFPSKNTESKIILIRGGTTEKKNSEKENKQRVTLVDWLAAFTMTQDPDKSTGSIHGLADCHIGREYNCE